MALLILNRISLVWLLLVFASFLSWDSLSVAQGYVRAAHVAVLVIAFFKVRLVGLQFMELRYAPRWCRSAFEAWLTIVCIILLVLVW